jgi:hypothetical protein
MDPQIIRIFHRTIQLGLGHLSARSLEKVEEVRCQQG